jgi:HD-GYP domain-containing protein (c-di-GMP phosphodiesterase class II)
MMNPKFMLLLIPIATSNCALKKHHEFWNDRGYPRGIAGEDIHIYSRITALADAYEAMRSKRRDKDAWPV